MQVLLYSLDGATYAAYPAGGYTVLLQVSTHTVSEQNAAGCNSTDCNRNDQCMHQVLRLLRHLTQVDPTCAVNTGTITLVPNAGSLI